jgi:quercetin dioxygenase-like cupin family protein
MCLIPSPDSNDQDLRKMLTCRRGVTFNSTKPTSIMLPDYIDFLIKRFENPDEVRTFEKGRFELIKIGGMTIGRATYEPGRKWSQHVAPVAGTSLCQVEHVGMVISGQAACAMEDGRSYVMKPGDIFYIGPGHDSWVMGDQPYVSLHFLGAESYAHD